jgi:hypothetical protein
MQSHLAVVIAFLNRIWQQPELVETRAMRATGILLERLIRFRDEDWALTLAIVANGGDWRVRIYVEQWVIGHFLDLSQVRRAEQHLNGIRARNQIVRLSRRAWRALHTTNWPLPG